MPELFVDGAWVSARSRAVAARSAARPTARSSPRSTRPAPRTPTPPSPRRTAPSTTAPGRAPPPASAATCCCAWPTCSSATADDRRRLESLDTGKRLVESEYDVADVVSVFRHYGGVAAEEAGRVVDTGNPDVVSRIVHEPVGVCGLITPWNYPLLQVSWKVAPCLAAGNTFVLKPSELTPHTAIHLMRLLEEAGLPAGRRQPRPRRRRRRRRAARPRTPASTWSRSPAAWRPAGGSWPPPPAR